MNLLSITHDPHGYKGWGCTAINLDRRGMLLLIWHLALSLVCGHKRVQFSWLNSGSPNGWYRISKPYLEMWSTKSVYHSEE